MKQMLADVVLRLRTMEGEVDKAAGLFVDRGVRGGC